MGSIRSAVTGDRLPAYLREAANLALPLLCLAAALFALSACAGHHIPSVESVSGREGVEVRAAFNKMVILQSSVCPDAIDAEVTVVAAYDGLMADRKIVLDGFLLAAKPSLLKYVAVNPLGQPMIIMTTDGSDFRYVTVAENREYSGSVLSETFRRFFPSSTGGDFYGLITGRPNIESMHITSVVRQPGTSLYWLTASSAGDESGHRISFFFDLLNGRLNGCRLLDGAGSVIVDIRYLPATEGVSQNGICAVADRVEMQLPSLKSSLSIQFASMRHDTELTVEDFSFTRPDHYQLIQVQ